MKKLSLRTIIVDIYTTDPNLWILFLLLAALALRMYFFIGLNFADDPWYVFLANQVCQGTFYATDNGALRLMMIYPLALLFKLFGVSNASASVYPMICSLGTIVVAYLSGRLLFNIQTGMIAALLLSFYPLNVIYASWFMPDVPVDFFTSLGILLFLSIYKKGRILSGFKQCLFSYTGGFLFGISYLANVRSIISFFVIGPFMLIFLWRNLRNKTRLLRSFSVISLFFIGFSTIILFEGLYHWEKSGDFFMTYHRTRDYYSDKGGFLREGVNNQLDYYPKLMFNLNHRLRFNMNNDMLPYGYFFYFFSIAALFLLFKRERRVYIPLWWFIALFSYLQFGSMSFKEYIPIHRLDRHLTVVTIPVVVIIAAFLSHLASCRLGRHRFTVYTNRLIAAGIIVLLFATSLQFTDAIVEDMRAPSCDMKEIYNFLKDYPGKDIYADPGVLSHLHFYFQFKNDHLRHNLLDAARIKPDSFVVLDGTRGFIENPRLESMLPRWARKPEPSWELVKVIKGPQIGIYASFDPKIYHVP